MPEAPASDTQSETQDRGFIDLPDFGALARQFGHWCARNPLSLVMLLLVFGVVGYFYFGVKAFMSLSQSPAQWMAASWTPENDQEHCVAIIPIAILLALLRWRDLEVADKTPSNQGIWWLLAGIFFYIAGIRCVEGRYPIIALSLLSYGGIMFLFGKEVARILRFPCAFLLFMVPLGFLVQSTAPLQTMTAKAVSWLFALTGPHITTSGNFIFSTENRFEPLEVAGGCSGIRSLLAMTVLAGLYAYFAMRTTWRGFVLFGCSIVFALIGNTVRVASIVLVARFGTPKAVSAYHDWSGFVFFPVAVLAMVAVGNLLNRHWSFASGHGGPSQPASPDDSSSTASTASAPKPQATYDY